MKLLLIALLVAIFSLQAGVVAVSDSVAASFTLNVQHGADGDSDDQQRKVNSAIEELSDYLRADLSIRRAGFSSPAARITEFALLSIDLPRIKPPPRA